LRLAGSSVWRDIVGTAEDLEGGVTLNAVFLAKVLLGGAVDLCELDRLVLERCGSFLVLRGEGLAVATPRCKD